MVQSSQLRYLGWWLRQDDHKFEACLSNRVSWRPAWATWWEPGSKEKILINVWCVLRWQSICLAWGQERGPQFNPQYHKQVNECVNEWTNEWVSEWMSKWMDKQMNEWMSETRLLKRSLPSSMEWTVNLSLLHSKSSHQVPRTKCNHLLGYKFVSLFAQLWPNISD